MRTVARLAGILSAVLLAGCWGGERGSDGSHCNQCDAATADARELTEKGGDLGSDRGDCNECDAALADARELTEKRGLDSVVVPCVRDAYRDLRRETSSMCGQDDQADLSPDGTWLAFASTELSNATDIFLKRASGPSLIQKTFNPTQEQFPRFSPDGKWLAFASDRLGGWDIFVMEVGVNGAVRQVTNNCADDIAPTWSPDGKRIAYSSRGVHGDWEIWIVNLENAQLTRLGPGLFPRWSPKADRIAFQRARQNCGWWYGIYIVEPSGNNVVELIASPDWAAIDPTWSPDGEWIAFATVHKSRISRAEGRTMAGDDIWIIRADGTSLSQVTVDEAPDWNPCWGVDGRLYFTTVRDGKQNIWSILPQVPGATSK